MKEVICNTYFYHSVCYIFWMRKFKAVTCRAPGFGFQLISYYLLRELAEVISLKSWLETLPASDQ
jgi:hypothetical protein